MKAGYGVTGSLGWVLALAACAPPDVPATLDGLWYGSVEHAGQRSDFAVRLDPQGADSVRVLVSMPAIGAYDVPLGTAPLGEGGVRLGGWALAFDAAEGTLGGALPSALAPVYQIPFTLRKVPELPPPPAVPTAPAVEPRWTFEVDAAVWAGVTVGEGVVYAGTDSGTVYALSEAGAQLWRRRLGGAIRATPTQDGGALYVADDGGFVTRLDARSGEVRWTRRLGGEASRVMPGQAGSRYDAYASSVLLVAGRGVVGTYDGTVVAFDPETGDEIWRTPTAGSVLGTLSTDGDVVFYASFDGDVGALDTDSGEELWRVRATGPIVGSPTRAGDLLLVGTRSYDLLALRARDGETAWSFYYWFSWVESSAVVEGTDAYVGSSDAQKLYAFDAASGGLRWAFPTEGSTWATPSVAAGTVYVGTVGVGEYVTAHRARFHAVDASTGDPVWRFALARPEGEGLWGFASSPAVGAEGVYVGGLDGRVYAFPAARPPRT